MYLWGGCVPWTHCKAALAPMQGARIGNLTASNLRVPQTRALETAVAGCCGHSDNAVRLSSRQSPTIRLQRH
jgi:hypothetical protein